MRLAEYRPVPVTILHFLIACVLLSAGCVGDLIDLTPRDGGGLADLTGGGNPDMAGGGTLSFATDINKDVTSPMGTCSASTCHGGTQIPLLKDNDAANNYTNFKAECNATMPAMSAVLTKGLPGAAHTGGSYFTGTNDAKYTKWLNWISGGMQP